MLEATGISMKAGQFLLDNVSLSASKSHIHVILGPTGSGKTLLLESIIGLRRPDTGNVIIDGIDATRLPVERRRLSYVPQDLALFPHMTVRDNILYGARARGIPRTTNDEIVRELVDSFGIGHIMNRSITNLSGGERQRIALARALASGCNYLLLDEPLSALHESLKKELWFLLKDLRKRYGLSIIMVTHDLEEAFFLGDSISVMINGEIRQAGDKTDIYNRPDDCDVAKFLGIRNLFGGEVAEIIDNTVVVFSNELATTVRSSTMNSSNRLRADFRPGAEVLLGIRSEYVEILQHDRPPRASYNMVGGVIEEIFDKAASFLVVIHALDSANGSKPLEAELPEQLFHQLRLEQGQTVTFSLDEEKVFVIRDESHEKPSRKIEVKTALTHGCSSRAD